MHENSVYHLLCEKQDSFLTYGCKAKWTELEIIAMIDAKIYIDIDFIFMHYLSKSRWCMSRRGMSDDGRLLNPYLCRLTVSRTPPKQHKTDESEALSDVHGSYREINPMYSHQTNASMTPLVPLYRGIGELPYPIPPPSHIVSCGIYWPPTDKVFL